MHSTRLIPPVLCAALAVAAACASSGGRAAKRDNCQLRASDSVFAVAGPVYRDCAVDRKARLLNRGDIRPDFRPTEMRSACFSADIELVVDPNGLPNVRTARIASTNNQSYAQSVLATVPTWRFEPAMRDGTPVRQIVSLHQVMSTMVTVTRAPAGSPPPPPSRATRGPTC